MSAGMNEAAGETVGAGEPFWRLEPGCRVLGWVSDARVVRKLPYRWIGA